jgi:hypothetical protein
MKTRKVLSHTLLITELFQQVLSNVFTPVFFSGYSFLQVIKEHFDWWLMLLA